jgi:hypothetical protein
LRLLWVADTTTDQSRALLRQEAHKLKLIFSAIAQKPE